MTVEFQLTTTGPGGAEYKVYLPNGEEQFYSISDRDCAMLRRNRESTLEHYILEDQQRRDPSIEEIRLVAR